MSDYISREAALNFETSVECKPERLEAVMEGMAIYGEYLKELPTANVVTWWQLKKAWAIATANVDPVVHGKWIEDGYNHYKAVCSECGEPCGTYAMNNPRDRFCKWCGAKMDGGDHNAVD